MSSMSVLTDAELDAVTGGWINIIGINFQTNVSTTNQGQLNAALVNLASNQGGGQLSQTVQSNSVG